MAGRLHASSCNLPPTRPGHLDVRIFAAVVSVLAVSVAAGLGVALLPGDPEEQGRAGASAYDAVPAAPSPSPVRSPAPVLAEHSTTDPASPWVVVNKVHPISPLDFRPDVSIVRGYQVASVAADALARLLDDSDRAGLGFKIASAFRSYAYQQQVHDATVASRGRAEAERVSARPGHSEHQTGLAVDLVTPLDPGCDFDLCFADTPGGRWLARRAWRYGFVVRYRVGDEDVTGYQPEPWHLRYVGRPLAAELHRTGTTTLEEYFGITGGPYR